MFFCGQRSNIHTFTFFLGAVREFCFLDSWKTIDVDDFKFTSCEVRWQDSIQNGCSWDRAQRCSTTKVCARCVFSVFMRSFEFTFDSFQNEGVSNRTQRSSTTRGCARCVFTVFMESFEFTFHQLVFVITHPRTLHRTQRAIPAHVAAYVHFRTRVDSCPELINDAFVCNFGITFDEAKQHYSKSFSALKRVEITEYRQVSASHNLDFASVRHGARGLRTACVQAMVYVAVLMRYAGILPELYRYELEFAQ